LPDDRPAIEAFMRGLEATKKLKFGHPRLGHDRDANGRTAYDSKRYRRDRCPCRGDRRRAGGGHRHVHRRASGACKVLCRAVPVLWSGLERKSAAGLGDDGAFYLVTGRLPFDKSGSRNAFLENLGSSLVFLIDWNKARKILREWVPKSDAIRVLA
jgi:hypothetical protein